MVRQINPALARLYSADLTRRYGTKNPIEIRVSSPAQQRALEMLEEGIPNNQVSQLGKLSGASSAEVTDLLTRLGGLLTQASGLGSDLTQLDIDKRFAELMRLFLTPGIDPILALRNRARSNVFIQEFSKSGLAISRALSNAGVRRFHTLDQQRVRAEDTGAMGYQASAVGGSRAQAANALLADDAAVVQHSRITSTLDKISVAVLMATDVVPPQSYQIWLARDTPHLAAVFTETGVWVSHLVIPGVTPCLGCLEIARVETDSEWIETATQLSFLDRDLSDAASIMFAASIVTATALGQLNGAELEGQILYLDRETLKVSRLEVPKANCGCQEVGSVPYPR